MSFKLLLGDCLVRLKELEDCSVDSIVTDPPYHLTSIVKRFGKEGSSPAKFGSDGAFQRASKGFMNQEWDGGDIAFRTEIWEECLRVLKPGGHILAFSSPRTYHRMAVAIEDAGFEIRDQIMWVYGSGFPKSHNVALGIDKQNGHKNRGRAIPTASTYQASDVEKKNKLTGNKVNAYIAKEDIAKEWEGWGTALKPAHEPICLARKPLDKKTIAENVIEYKTGAININSCRIGDEEITINKLEDWSGFGEYKNPDYSSEKSIGRWPANFLHDGSEEWSKYFYCPKANKKDRNEGCESLEQKQYSLDGRDTPIENAYQRNNSVASNNHPTVKPTDLMRYLCRLITPKNGLVLDPFMGSGSTGKAAVLENFSFIGVELSEEYLNIAEKRIKHVITKDE
jgi:site-specific DNA-methyltransferase (adenine-specific)